MHYKIYCAAYINAFIRFVFAKKIKTERGFGRKLRGLKMTVNIIEYNLEIRVARHVIC